MNYYSLLITRSVILLMLTSFAFATEVTFEPIVVGQSFSIDSKRLKQKRNINVYLPPSYKEGELDYPVLYLLDGGVKEDFLHIMGIASLAADYRNIEEFILVGIEGIDRKHELTSLSDDPRDKKELPTHGGSKLFRQFIASELIPFIDKHYRTTPKKVLMGESLAGLFVVETLLTKHRLFSGYIAVSPSLWWNKMSLTERSEEILERIELNQKVDLYLSIGNEQGGLKVGVDKLVRALKLKPHKNLYWQYQPMISEKHSTIFHPAALEGVRMLFQKSKQHH